jgi:hypothetical protein
VFPWFRCQSFLRFVHRSRLYALNIIIVIFITATYIKFVQKEHICFIVNNSTSNRLWISWVHINKKKKRWQLHCSKIVWKIWAIHRLDPILIVEEDSWKVFLFAQILNQIYLSGLFVLIKFQTGTVNSNGSVPTIPTKYYTIVTENNEQRGFTRSSKRFQYNTVRSEFFKSLIIYFF